MRKRSSITKPVNTSKKPVSNGYGSFINKVVVRVDTEHVEAFKQAFDTKPFRVTEQHSDFIMSTSSRTAGDDEGVLYEVDYRLPDLPSFTGWSILWEERVF